jgi:hypothetical protein
MNYRDFELANDQCKPKHFGPPTALQRRLAREAADRLPAVEPTLGQRILGWLRRFRAHVLMLS